MAYRLGCRIWGRRQRAELTGPVRSHSVYLSLDSKRLDRRITSVFGTLTKLARALPYCWAEQERRAASMACSLSAGGPRLASVSNDSARRTDGGVTVRQRAGTTAASAGLPRPPELTSRCYA